MTTKSLTLSQIFGAGATQTEMYLRIFKADLKPDSSDGDRAESLLVALLLHLQRSFEGVLIAPGGQSITDEQGLTLRYDNSALYEKLIFQYWKRQYPEAKIRDRFLLDVFISPPIELEEPLIADLLS